MAASFYSRYVPPSNHVSSKPADTLDSPARSEKRKRKLETPQHASSPPTTPAKKARKREGQEKTGDNPVVYPQSDSRKRRETDPSARSKNESSVSPPTPKKQNPSAIPNQTLQTDKVQSGSNGRGVSASRTSVEKSPASIGVQGQKTDLDGNTKAPEKKKKRRLANADGPEDSTLAKSSSEKHARILSKYEKSKSTAQSTSLTNHATSDSVVAESQVEDIPTHGLEPLPQPAPAPQDTEQPTYSTLPSWLTEPFAVPSSSRQNFAELGINANLVSVLQKRGYKQAFPIQSAILQLLASGEDAHSGDICISAATGSGKTLAYALPMVSSIKPSLVSRLRGLVVVPTRELVKQAREACELCATGSGLRIGTAVGTTSLKEEQALLMRYDQVYDPSTYQTRETQPLSADDWASFSLQEYISEAERSQTSFPGHVSTPSPNIDILICTPGRLVDHIRSTKGFTLEYLQWLVVDEADRLLNESFQEWVEIVVPALEAAKAPSSGKATKIVRDLGYSTKKSQLRKIILSATMTRDIAKLNSLRLQNPKLVVPENVVTNDAAEVSQGTPEKDHERDDTGFVLPPNLCEMFVPVGDGADKPLYLLSLLSRFKLVRGGNPKPLRKQHAHSETSDSDSTSSSDSADDSSSDESSSSDDSEDSTTDSHKFKPSLPPTSSVLVFTKSSESASRLARLLALMEPSLARRIGTLTKSKSSTSRKTLSAYRNGKISIVIATDRASRGLDLPSLSHVVSYDVPTSLTSYIHRVGRTARAGRSGSAWTLVTHREGRWFANEIVKCQETTVTRAKDIEKVTIKIDDQDSDLQERYSKALRELEAEVTEESKKQRKLERPTDQ
ncbi:ATP-dependent RNA helicase dbp6 [Emmonsiellopsis sp. PD_33]|nr:ATP-dependent RNA helicase dbp6 [Emmonsiellopsis sp. PD_33]